MELYPLSQLIRKTLILLTSLPALLLISCGGGFQPSTPPAVIEESVGGMEVIEREFSECIGEDIPDNPLNYVQFQPNPSSSYSAFAYQQNNAVKADFPHLYDSINRAFPLRGSWRQSKAEILDIVDRRLWSPEQGRDVPLLEYFDLVLMFNVAARSSQTSEASSAQRVQVMARNGASNNLNDWRRLATWPISSGKPCGQKIETPTGVFKFDPSRAHEDYGSNAFRDENGEKIQMYETMFLYHSYQAEPSAANRCAGGVCPTGVALHGTYVTEKLGRQDSGGCIRLYRDEMTCLFKTLKGDSPNQCLAGSLDSYWGRVPSLVARNGEADPEYLSSGGLEVQGYKVLVVIFNDRNDTL